MEAIIASLLNNVELVVLSAELVEVSEASVSVVVWKGIPVLLGLLPAVVGVVAAVAVGTRQWL